MIGAIVAKMLIKNAFRDLSNRNIDKFSQFGGHNLAIFIFAKEGRIYPIRAYPNKKGRL